ncbi:MAG: biotin--[acetyl-CoA-carboxylase] ligase [Bacteroidales bacterium]|nr:biotin--[acetyl-CoA-carboxylase] ligase [Bacteroidales bacterium]
MNYLFLPITTSTNEIARQLIQQQRATHGYVIRTDFQEKGRGRQGNSWESIAGENLLISLIVKPKFIHPSEQFIINQLVSTTLYDFVQQKIGSNDIFIKWPNDIYVGNKKIAGILIEHILMGEEIIFSIIGIGMNINQTTFNEAQNPISLRQITQQTYNVEIIAQQLSEQLFKTFDNWNKDQAAILKKSYTQSLYNYNKKQRFLVNDKEITATILGVTDEGLLRLLVSNDIEMHFELNSIKYLI